MPNREREREGKKKRKRRAKRSNSHAVRLLTVTAEPLVLERILPKLPTQLSDIPRILKRRVRQPVVPSVVLRIRTRTAQRGRVRDRDEGGRAGLR